MAGKKKKVVLDIFPYIWVSVSFCSLVERKKKTIADPRFRFLHTILQVCICCELISVLRSLFPHFLLPKCIQQGIQQQQSIFVISGSCCLLLMPFPFLSLFNVISIAWNHVVSRSFCTLHPADMIVQWNIFFPIFVEKLRERHFPKKEKMKKKNERLYAFFRSVSFQPHFNQHH